MSSNQQQLPPVQLTAYTIAERLGAGSYGNVYKAHGKTGTREAVAVKCVLKSQLCKAEVDNIITEISLLKRLKHPHIVEMKDFAWDANYIYIIMDYYGGGDLSRFIKSRSVLAEDVVKKFLQQLALALRYLRSKHVAHMDLKPSNILLSSPRKPVLKLADFGFAQHFSDEETATKIKGSPLYMAPEMLLRRKYDAKVDIWSVGIILYEALFGRAPYKSETIEEVLVKIKERQPIVIPRGRKISEPCRDLLTRCLKTNPEERLGFEEFFEHPFLDLEHAPSEESHQKAVETVVKAVKLDNEGDLEGALELYTAALEYFVPLTQSEYTPSRKEALRKRTMDYMRRAREIKNALHPDDDATAVPPSASLEVSSERSPNQVLHARTSVEADQFQELVQLSHMTPKLATGLEIARAAEEYELEAQFIVALEKYQAALGILIPALQSELAGSRRRKLLHDEVSKWMRRAECVKETLAIQEKVLTDSVAMSADAPDAKTCKMQ